MKTCCPLAVLILIAGGCLLHGAEAHGQLLRSWRFFRRERPDRRTVSPTERALNPPPLAVAPFGFREAVGHQEAWATYLDRPVELTNSVGMELRLLPPGEFMMGSPESEEGRLPWEVPRHRVRITRPFYLGMYPVTQSQWESVMGSNPSYFSSEGRGGNWVSRFATGDFPVESVSWDDAQEFLQKLNEQSGEPGWVYRLPTEAEWEYACRAGTTMRYHFGDDVAYLGEYAWYSGNTGGWGKARPYRVGQKRPNPWGLHDTHGNVFEWCSDLYGADYYTNSPVDDPTGPTSGSARVNRGGSWDGTAWSCRAACRRSNSPGFRFYNLGLRVAFSSVDRPSE